MQKNLKLLIIFFFLVIMLVFAVFFYGKAQGRSDVREMEAVVSSRLILERIKDQYFLVTKTLFFDEEIEIVASENSTWKDFLWGEKIIAKGLVRVDIGVDIKKMEASDIDINVAEKIIEVKLPLADILDSSLSGELDITTRKGVFSNIKDIFSEDEAADYNKAVEELIRNAEAGVREKSDIFREAREDSRKIIELILDGLENDYRVEIVAE